MSDATQAPWRLIAITDDLRDGVEGLVSRAQAAERGGATMLLLRLKHLDARTELPIAQALVQALAIPVVVSERLDVALASGARGVHLSSTSVPAIAARSQAPAGFLLGGSVSGEADIARTHGADYVTIGPVFGPPLAAIGLEGFQRLVAACDCPAVAVGGIDALTAPQVFAAGAAGVAVIRSVLGSTDPEAAARVLA